MVKLTRRKGFNFFRSYYDVFNELDTKNKLAFMQALLDKQFLGVEPSGLTGLAKFAYISQMNSINSQVKGYQDKTGNILTTDPKQGGRQGGAVAPMAQVEGKGKGEVEGKGKGEKIPPQINLVKDYFFEKLQAKDLADFEAEKFSDFYSSKNWMVGKTKMKDWQAAVRNWIRRISEDKNKNENRIDNVRNVALRIAGED